MARGLPSAWPAKGALIGCCLVVALIVRPLLRGVAALVIDGIIVAGLATGAYWVWKKRRFVHPSALSQSGDRASKATAFSEREHKEVKEPGDQPRPSDRAAGIEVELEELKRTLGKKERT